MIRLRSLSSFCIDLKISHFFTTRFAFNDSCQSLLFFLTKSTLCFEADLSDLKTIPITTA